MLCLKMWMSNDVYVFLDDPTSMYVSYMFYHYLAIILSLLTCILYFVMLL